VVYTDNVAYWNDEMVDHVAEIRKNKCLQNAGGSDYMEHRRVVMVKPSGGVTMCQKNSSGVSRARIVSIFRVKQ
jgi:hypothetical protein